MPPIPSWYRGRAEIGALTGKTVFGGDAAGRWRLIPTRANGQIAFGLYRVDEGYGIQVLTFRDGLIADVTTFRNPKLMAYFQLPQIENRE
jgi:RNA polymerase sigma-70 factor (ECF subfamily)